MYAMFVALCLYAYFIRYFHSSSSLSAPLLKDEDDDDDDDGDGTKIRKDWGYRIYVF